MTTKRMTTPNHLLQSQERIDGFYHEQYMKDQIKRVQDAKTKKEAERKIADKPGNKK